MGKKIITISREFGSGGRFIGEALAKKLGIPFYDKEIIAKTAEESGLAHDFIEKRGEYSPKKGIFSYAFVGRDSSGNSLEDYVHFIQRKIILDIAEKGPCVIVGRGADYILRERNDCMNVYIHGNKPEKIARIKNLYGTTEEETVKLIKETDKRRSINYKYYTDQTWGDARNYTLSLNSSELGYDTCIRILAGLAESIK